MFALRNAADSKSLKLRVYFDEFERTFASTLTISPFSKVPVMYRLRGINFVGRFLGKCFWAPSRMFVVMVAANRVERAPCKVAAPEIVALLNEIVLDNESKWYNEH